MLFWIKAFGNATIYTLFNCFTQCKQLLLFFLLKPTCFHLKIQNKNYPIL